MQNLTSAIHLAALHNDVSVRCVWSRLARGKEFERNGKVGCGKRLCKEMDNNLVLISFL